MKEIILNHKMNFVKEEILATARCATFKTEFFSLVGFSLCTQSFSITERLISFFSLLENGDSIFTLNMLYVDGQFVHCLDYSAVTITFRIIICLIQANALADRLFGNSD